MASEKKRNQDGYTLTELLVVLVIIALLTSIVAPRLIGRVGSAKSTTARTQIENIMSALEIYHLDMGEFPNEEQGLDALITKPDGADNWQGPYLHRGKVPLDPWNRDYRYTLAATDQAAIVSSFGKDGKEGGDGENRDITSQD